MSAALVQTRAGWLSEAAKLAFGGGVLVAIVGTYLGVVERRDAARTAAAPLPGAETPTGACTLWFVGSSTIFRWTTLTRDFAPWDAHDRGVNGAMLPEIVQGFGNEPAGHAPAAIVFYAGENDIARGATPDEAFADFRRFLDLKTRRFGAVPVVVVSAKPSPTRWSNLPTQSAYNAELQQLATTRADLSFVDIRPLMFDQGSLGPFYAEDGVHLNTQGYARWTARLRPALARRLPAPTVRTCLGEARGR